MRRLRTAKPTAGVSLFPFLAVLLCTMGALIVVLVVIARQSRLQAAAAVDQDRPPPSAQLASRVDGLRTARDNTLRQLAGQRAQLSRLEDQDRRLRARLAELESAAAQLERTASAAGERQALVAELAEVRARADEARRQLAEAVEAAGNQSNSFAIIPYDGKRGTRRRPLYIECRADSVVLQPEGIVLTEDDFRGPLGPANPLAAGLRAASDYLAGSRETSMPAGDPYPLLLVRPDGILAYAAARAAMRSWGDNFGYELIDADWPLEFPAADAAMASRIQEAVEVARRRQRMLARSAPREWRSYDAPNFRHIPPRGGSIADEGWAGAGGRGERGTHGLASPGSGIGGHAGDTLGSGAGAARRPSAGRFEGHESPVTGHVGGRAIDVGGARSANGGSVQRGPLMPEGETPGTPGPDGPQAGFGRGETSGAARPPSGTAGAGTSRAGNVSAGTNDPGGESLARSRRGNWALPNVAADSVPVTRPITIVCEPDRLILLDDKKSTREATFVPLAERTEDSLDDFVSAIWQRIDSWGIAGRQMYWRPILSVQVAPGGEQRFEDLKALLAESGLDVRAAAARAAAIQYPRTKTPD